MKSKPWIWHYITCNSEFSTYPLTSCWCLFGLCWFHPLIGFPLGVGLLLSRNLSILIEIEIKFSLFVLMWENSLCDRCTKLLRVLLILLGHLFLYWSVTMYFLGSRVLINRLVFLISRKRSDLPSTTPSDSGRSIRGRWSVGQENWSKCQNSTPTMWAQ